MRRPAACRLRPARIDRGIPFFNRCDLAIHVDNKRRAVRHAYLRDQHPILLRHRTLVIAEQHVSRVEFFFPVVENKRGICADANYLSIHCVKFCNTSLVCGEFLRSTTGEGGGIERQDDGVLAAEIG